MLFRSILTYDWYSSDQIPRVPIMSNAIYLENTDYFDFHHPEIQSLISQLKATSTEAKVLEAYYLVRDSIAYNPYTFAEGKNALKASYAATHKSAYCIPKSALLVAICRGLNVPARIGLADVKNHLSSPKLLAWLKTDEFVMHGYTDIFLDNNWVKCTPVFDRSLCEKFGIMPLDFDGKTDSVFHQFTGDGQKHMEYIREHGTFADMPVEQIFAAAKKAYPHIDLETLNRHSIATSLESEIVNLNPG